METNAPEGRFNDGNSFSDGYVPDRKTHALFIDVTFFSAAIKSCYEAITGKMRKNQRSLMFIY